MERLTFDGNFCDIAQCHELPCKYGGNCSQKQVWERLREYEDAGLSPKACTEAREIEETLSGYDYSISRMVELMKADVEGRVVVLPCKVGDTVYRVITIPGQAPCCAGKENRDVWTGCRCRSAYREAAKNNQCLPHPRRSREGAGGNERRN